MEYDKTIWSDAEKVLPPVGQMVIVLTKEQDNKTNPKGSFSISLGMRLDNESQKYLPAYGNGGWNKKDVVLWSPLGLPQQNGDPVLEMEISALQHVIDIMQGQMQCYSGRTLDNIIQNLTMILHAKKKRFNGSNKNT